MHILPPKTLKPTATGLFAYGGASMRRPG